MTDVDDIARAILGLDASEWDGLTEKQRDAIRAVVVELVPPLRQLADRLTAWLDGVAD